MHTLRRSLITAALSWIMCIQTGCEKPATPPPNTAAVAQEVKEKDEKALAVQFVEWLSQSEWQKARALFDKTMVGALSEQKTELMWTQIVAANGAFKEITGTFEGEHKGYKIIWVNTRFEKSELGLRVVMDKEKKIAGFFIDKKKEGAQSLDAKGEKQTPPPKKANRPQTPKPPFDYEIRQVSYKNPKDDTKFAGTLTFPKGKGPFPAVVLITGSGAQDRDETLFGHKPFFVIADHLTRNGIAVLRVDDRGVGESTGKADNTSIELHASDALAALAFLETQKEVDPKRMGLLGHSEGGAIAPLAASQSPKVGFVVSLAGPGLTGAEVVTMQVEDLSSAAGMKGEDLKEAVALQSRIMKMVAEDADEKKLKAALGEGVELSMRLAGQKMSAEQRQAQIDIQYAQLTSTWYQSFVKFDPAPAWKKTSCPVLAIIGEKDLQVRADPNLAAINKALEQGGNKSVTTKKLKGLNHAFQNAKTGMVQEYATIEETFDPTTIDLISNWIRQNTGLETK